MAKGITYAECKALPKPQNKYLYFAHNPEDENDGRWFRDEAQAFDHFCEYGRVYRYTCVNEADGTAELLDAEFAERRDDTPGNREASDADRWRKFMRESA